ncbi:c-type cytochrome [Ruegeria atlantica]|uniref:c-type cytochrome n=1 Tax=Ruegeria atlantica TaxID=81569 RepID=UPI0015844766|nr:cytochrome c [Ruegeria atlantica]
MQRAYDLNASFRTGSACSRATAFPNIGPIQTFAEHSRCRSRSTQSRHSLHKKNRGGSYARLGGEVALVARGVNSFVSGMPGFGEILTNADIWDILAYIRSTWPDDIQRLQASRNLPHE